MPNDVSDFVDSDFLPASQAAYMTPQRSPEPAPPSGNRPPTREEIESLVSQKQQKLAELKRAQEELERERAALEELRQRQDKFQSGRQEMLQNLTRGIGLMEEAELAARRDADQMSRVLAEFRGATSKIQALNENAWNKDNLTVELTRALTVIENARIEWHSAQIRFPILNGETEGAGAAAKNDKNASLASLSLAALCKIGFALTWPLVLLGLGILGAILWRR